MINKPSNITQIIKKILNITNKQIIPVVNFESIPLG